MLTIGPGPVPDLDRGDLCVGTAGWKPWVAAGVGVALVTRVGDSGDVAVTVAVGVMV